MAAAATSIASSSNNRNSNFRYTSNFRRSSNFSSLGNSSNKKDQLMQKQTPAGIDAATMIATTAEATTAKVQW